MNRHLLTQLTLTAALVLLGMTACQKDDAPQRASGSTDVVTFEATATDATRATAVPAGALGQSETFRVYATKRQDATLSEYIADDGTNNIVSYGLVYPDVPFYDVNYGVTAWHTSGRYTWTGDYTYNFYAVYPATAPAINHSADYQTITIDYTGSYPVDGHTDLLIAISENAEKNARGIPLTFRHAMTQVQFKGKMAAEFSDWTVSVSGIRLCNINAAGTYYYNTIGTAPSATAIPVPGLGSSSGNSSFVPDTGNPCLQTYPLTMNASLLTDGKITVSSTTESVQLTSPTDITIVMPQTLTAWDKSTTIGSTTGAYVAIDCTIADNTSTQMFSGTAYVPLGSTWAPQQIYSYLLTFGCGFDAQGRPNIARISLTASINDWGTYETGDTKDIKL